MPDTYTLHLKNFRSIRDAKIDIAPLTVIYGPNGTGKSSLIYGLLTLRNFLTNPAQNLPSLFSYPTMSLGGLREVVRNHSEDGALSLSIGVSDPPGWASNFTLSIEQSGGGVAIVFGHDDWPIMTPLAAMNLEIPFPYHADQMTSHRFSIEYVLAEGPGAPDADATYGDLTWNGIAVGVDRRTTPDRVIGVPGFTDLLTRANSPMEIARRTGFVPLRRGFATPTYGVSSVTPALASDMEVASLLATERFVQYEVSEYVEMVANRRINTHAQIGTSTFTIDSIPRHGGVPVSIVNEGFGINQLTHMLTVCLYPEFKTVVIEEPEIHLHPSMIRKLVHAMVDITSKHDRRLIVSTHSETFVMSLLAQVAAGKVSVDDVSFILAEKEDGESRFTKQEAKSNGQIQGGLHSFMASELEDIAVFLGLND